MGKVWARIFQGDNFAGMPQKAWAVLMLIALAVTVPGVASIPTMDRDEARYSQAARQMIETGDYVDIKFQEQDRHVKPIGIYWMQVAAVTPFGGADAPQWAHRLPSVIGALAAVAATAWLAARIAGPQAGFSAALLLALTLGLAVEARTMKTDAVLLASGAFAQAALFVILRRGTDATKFWGAPAVFWAASGFALMVKGPIIAMVSATTALGYGLWARDWSWVKRLKILPGIGVLIAIAAPWLIAITVKTGGGFLEESIGHALMGKVAQGDDSHGAPPGYHTVLFLATFWPGAALAALMAAYAWVKRADADVKFLIAWVVPTWIIFEAVATKLPHYILPTFPAFALLAAFAIRDGAHMLQNTRVRRAHWIMMALAGVVSLAIAFLPLIAERELGQPHSAASFAAALVGVALTAAMLFLAAKPSAPRLLPLAAATFAFYIAAFQIAIPGIDRLWVTDRMAQEVAALNGCEEISVATAGTREPSNVFLFGTKTVLGDGAIAAEHLLANPDCGLALVDGRDKDAFLATLEAADAEHRSLGNVQGTNYVKGRDLDMELLVLDGARLTR
ncbi:MAG: glycosyltransferase family 39 protein [Pseudomonadota bacterium]